MAKAPAERGGDGDGDDFRFVDLTAASAYAGKEHTFPSLRWGEWYPTPGEVSHFGVLGTTGSGKSDLLQMLFRSGDLNPTTLYFVTDNVDTEPVEAMVEYCQRRVEEAPPALRATYLRAGDDPNLRMWTLRPDTFVRIWSLDKMRLNVKLKGVPLRQYTVVVLDDASGVPGAVVNRVARAGRGKGVTLVPTMQGFRKKEEIPLETVRQLSGAWFVGDMGRQEREVTRYLAEFGLRDPEKAKRFAANTQRYYAQFVSKFDPTVYVVKDRF